MKCKPKILDLFCGAGGASLGYHKAGFEVVGVDIKPQPHYPFEFIQCDVMNYEPLHKPWLLADDGFVAIHASPPCQRFSLLSSTNSYKPDKYPDLVAPVRELLRRSGLRYVIENVVGAPLIKESSIKLCGTMFDLVAADRDGEMLFLRRHRLFESNVKLFTPTHCDCMFYKNQGYRCAGVHGGGPHDKASTRGGYQPTAAIKLELMGLEPKSMTMAEANQAIPPAYTEWIGKLLLTNLPVYGSMLCASSSRISDDVLSERQNG